MLSGAASVLEQGNLLRALCHFPVVRLLVVDDSAASAEAWALVGSLLIKTKVAASGQPSLPLLRCLAQELGTLLPRVKD